MTIRIRTKYSTPIQDFLYNYPCAIRQYIRGDGKRHSVHIRLEIAPNKFATLELQDVATWGQGSCIEVCDAVGMAQSTRDYLITKVPGNFDWMYQLNSAKTRIFRAALNQDFCFTHNHCMRIIR